MLCTDNPVLHFWITFQYSLQIILSHELMGSHEPIRRGRLWFFPVDSKVRGPPDPVMNEIKQVVQELVQVSIVFLSRLVQGSV